MKQVLKGVGQDGQRRRGGGGGDKTGQKTNTNFIITKAAYSPRIQPKNATQKQNFHMIELRAKIDRALQYI